MALVFKEGFTLFFHGVMDEGRRRGETQEFLLSMCCFGDLCILELGADTEGKEMFVVAVEHICYEILWLDVIWCTGLETRLPRTSYGTFWYPQAAAIKGAANLLLRTNKLAHGGFTRFTRGPEFLSLF